MTDALRQICTDCGYVYDPEDNGGIALVERAEWECPGLEGSCGASIDKYDLLEPESPLQEDESEDPSSAFEGGKAGVVQPNTLHAERADKAVIDLVRMFEEKELILRPDWQRYYVWSNRQASQLVESLFLRLPIPLIYLAEEDDGTFSVVDGQQRLTALIEFVRNKHVDPTKSGDLRLSGLEVLTGIEGRRFSELDKKDQSFIKNRELSIVRLRSDSDPDLKLKVFRRLNTGSVKLNAQELRNAAFRGPYNDELKKWATNPSFLKLVGTAGQSDIRMLDVEMVLRFSAWLNRGWTTLTSKNLGDFLDSEMELGKTYSAKKLATIGQKFKIAVDLSLSTFGERAFRRYFPGATGNETGTWEQRQVNKALFDVVMFGFTQYTKPQLWPHLEAIRESLIDLMATDLVFTDSITSGTSDPKRVKYRFTTWIGRLDAIVQDDPQQRSFSRKLKSELFAASRYCALCKQEIVDLDDAHVHHVEHYWRGGKTVPSNAALTHRFCNLSEGAGDLAALATLTETQEDVAG